MTTIRTFTGKTFHEAYVGDVSSPLKAAMRRNGEPSGFDVVDAGGIDWPGLPDPEQETIAPLPWQQAEAFFLERYHHLSQKLIDAKRALEVASSLPNPQVVTP